jgi:hypothetical protein
MSTLLHGNIIPFPSDDLAPPRAVSTREIAAAIIDCSPAHKRAVAEGRSRRTEPSATITDVLSDFDNCPTRAMNERQNVSNRRQSVPRRGKSLNGLASSEISTRPGNGWFNAALWSRCLVLRQLELEFAPVVVINREWARCVEKRVSAALYPKEAR